MKNFVNKAIGVPFKDRGRDHTGWDCWGLIWRAYCDVLGLELPCLEDVPALQNWQAKDIFALVHREHIEVHPGQERPGDVLVFRGLPVHVALVVEPGLMLHVEEGIATCVESYRSVLWRHKLIGIYRHAASVN